MQYDDTKLNLDKTTHDLKEAELRNTILRIEKEEINDKYKQEVRKLSIENEGDKQELNIIQVNIVVFKNYAEVKLTNNVAGRYRPFAGPVNKDW